MINEQIRDKEVRLIGANGEQLGIMSARDAMKIAREAELDLVKVAPTAKPPVCKIIDYGKYKYEMARKEKEAKKRQKIIEIKEVRLSPNIDDNDLNTKCPYVSAAVRWLIFRTEDVFWMHLRRRCPISRLLRRRRRWKDVRC